MAVPAYKRALSFLFPMPLEHAVCNGMETELVVYRNRLQLGTADAVYSDGMQYMPALEVAKQCTASLKEAKNVLVLGAGLCSAVSIFYRAGCRARFTLVEQNETILQWAVEYVLYGNKVPFVPVCEDAAVFMKHNTEQYDFIFTDVFVGRYVPLFVSSPAFIDALRQALTPGGHMAMNYIINDAAAWQQLQACWRATFAGGEVVEKRENRILIA